MLITNKFMMEKHLLTYNNSLIIIKNNKNKDFKYIKTKIWFYQNLLEHIVSIIVAIYYTKKNLKKFHVFYKNHITSILYIFFVIPNL